MVESCTVFVNDLEWIIKKVPEDSEFLRDGEHRAYGMCYPDSLTIYIQESGLSKQLYYRFLKHELTHAYKFSYWRSKETWNEEDVCEWMESFAEKIIDDAIWATKQLYGYKIK